MIQTLSKIMSWSPELIVPLLRLNQLSHCKTLHHSRNFTLTLRGASIGWHWELSHLQLFIVCLALLVFCHHHQVVFHRDGITRSGLQTLRLFTIMSKLRRRLKNLNRTKALISHSPQKASHIRNQPKPKNKKNTFGEK